MASSDDRLLDFNENTVGPRPPGGGEDTVDPGDQYAIYPEYVEIREEVAATLGCT